MEFSSSEIQVLTTLRMVAQLKSENKLLTTKKHVAIDKNTGFMQSISRFMRNENSYDNLTRIKQTFAEAFDMLRKQRIKSTSEHICASIEDALTGLKSLQITYYTDLNFSSNIDVLISTIRSRIEALRKANFVIESWVPFEW